MVLYHNRVIKLPKEEEKKREKSENKNEKEGEQKKNGVEHK